MREESGLSVIFDWLLGLFLFRILVVEFSNFVVNLVIDITLKYGVCKGVSAEY